mmetsp:Transcript_62219/g.122951  ORF Transcript_62219/g.122951 Transcript_62219/m.122951 type:complete len:102 (-) Transcript_62219:320-625(-)
MREARPWLAVLRRGVRFPCALSVNLIVWTFAKHGVVRFAPYSEDERLSDVERWWAYAEEQRGRSLWERPVREQQQRAEQERAAAAVTAEEAAADDALYDEL